LFFFDIAGFLDLLSQLTEVGNYNEAVFKARFSQMQSLPEMYKTIVIEGETTAAISPLHL